jgi:YVTN family beta-propeller protein
LGVRERIPLRDLPGVGRSPYTLVALGDKFYTLNTQTENLTVIQNDRVVKFVPLGKRPTALTGDPTPKRLYVGYSDKTIALIANDQIGLTQSIAEEPAALLFQENRLFVGSSSKANIFVLDPTTLQIQRTSTIPNASSILNLVGDPARHRLYAVAYEKIAAIDLSTGQILSTQTTKGSYVTFAVTPSGENLFVALYESATNTQFLTALDPVSGAARGRVKIGGDPRGAVFSPDGTRLYVANSFTNDVSVIDPRTPSLVATIAVDLRPYALAFDETARRLYVANYGSDNVSIIDTPTNQVVGTIPLGMNITALIVNENTGRVYAASASTDSVFVVEGTRVVKEVNVGRHPADLARDTANNRVLVANVADGTLALIDETNLTVRVTPPITRALSTVAVDPARARIFAGGVMLDANTLASVGQLTISGNTIGSVINPQLVRVNPNLNRVYAVGWNGTPGSNSRNVTYSIDGNTLRQRGTLPYYGNHDQIAIDSKTNRVFVAGTHPMAFTNELDVFDADDAKIYALPLAARPAGIAYNPETNHLFLSQRTEYARSFGPTPVPADHSVLILDTNSFGQVAQLSVNAPGKMTRLGNTIYVANRDDGSLTLIQDTNMPTPPSPTPTLTPTPYPTAGPPAFIPTRTVVAPRMTAAPTATLTPPICAIPLLPIQRWTMEMATRLGCPAEEDRAVDSASQRFEHGAMFWRAEDRRILVLFNDKTWLPFNDTWASSMPEDACPNVTVASSLLKPKRGFGKVWCEQTGVRAKLGAAVENEIGTYAVLAQRFERGQIFVGTEPSKVYVLYNDGKWE